MNDCCKTWVQYTDDIHESKHQDLEVENQKLKATNEELKAEKQELKGRNGALLKGVEVLSRLVDGYEKETIWRKNRGFLLGTSLIGNSPDAFKQGPNLPK